MNVLIITADLGRIKAYSVTQESDEESHCIKLIGDLDLNNAYSRFANRDTDQAGRFPSGQSGMAAGERHEEKTEARRVQMKRVAAEINSIVEGSPEAPIYLAAPQTINQQLLDQLNSETRERIRRNLARDLVKETKSDLLQRFEIG